MIFHSEIKNLKIQLICISCSDSSCILCLLSPSICVLSNPKLSWFIIHRWSWAALHHKKICCGICHCAPLNRSLLSKACLWLVHSVVCVLILLPVSISCNVAVYIKWFFGLQTECLLCHFSWWVPFELMLVHLSLHQAVPLLLQSFRNIQYQWCRQHSEIKRCNYSIRLTF